MDNKEYELAVEKYANIQVANTKELSAFIDSLGIMQSDKDKLAKLIDKWSEMNLDIHRFCNEHDIMHHHFVHDLFVKYWKNI